MQAAASYQKPLDRFHAEENLPRAAGADGDWMLTHSNHGTHQILLVEDNPADVALVREAFKEHGVSCGLHVVRDGAEAIGFIERLDEDRREPPLDLLLLDMHLPKRGGADILKRLRSTERYAQTPVIVMTGSTSTQDEEAANKNAALHYFRKPSSAAQFLELGAIVRGLLAGRSLGSAGWARERTLGGAA